MHVYKSWNAIKSFCIANRIMQSSHTRLSLVKEGFRARYVQSELNKQRNSG